MEKAKEFKQQRFKAKTLWEEFGLTSQKGREFAQLACYPERPKEKTLESWTCPQLPEHRWRKTKVV